MEEQGQEITLSTVFDRLNIPFQNFTIDTLDMRAVPSSTGLRVAQSYDPLRKVDLRTVFLKVRKLLEFPVQKWRCSLTF